MMATMATLAAVALVALSLFGGQKVNVTQATNTNTVTFNSTNALFLQTVSSSSKTTSPETTYGTTALPNHNNVLAAAIQFPSDTRGTITTPSDSLVAASIGGTPSTVYGKTIYESTAGLMIGLNNITSISVIVTNPASATINSLYFYFYDANFTSVGNDIGGSKTSSTSGSTTTTTDTVASPSGKTVRWLEIDFTTNSPSSTEGLPGAVISAVTMTWSC